MKVIQSGYLDCQVVGLRGRPRRGRRQEALEKIKDAIKTYLLTKDSSLPVGKQG